MNIATEVMDDDLSPTLSAFNVEKILNEIPTVSDSDPLSFTDWNSPLDAI